jgi:hypothetical protein
VREVEEGRRQKAGGKGKGIQILLFVILVRRGGHLEAGNPTFGGWFPQKLTFDVN